MGRILDICSDTLRGDVPMASDTAPWDSSAKPHSILARPDDLTAIPCREFLPDTQLRTGRDRIRARDGIEPEGGDVAGFVVERRGLDRILDKTDGTIAETDVGS